ncbi:hypothetical protein JB92DRAFT_3126275 [Gautieria morchelliformis]|nr:hypothetical protein JB92DRAFT_3126275 [Gautieria morchelliformis]
MPLSQWMPLRMILQWTRLKVSHRTSSQRKHGLSEREGTGANKVGQGSHSSKHTPHDNILDIDIMWVKDFPEPAGVSYGEQKTTFEVLREEQRTGSLGTFGPFEDLAKWELAEWLIKSGASQSEIDKCYWILEGHFLVQVNGDVHDYNGERRIEELFIWCHNPVDCVKELIGNPAFKEAMNYALQKVFTGSTEEDQVFNEMWTGEWWWELQEKLPKGATIALIIIVSDNTQLCQFSGDKQAWPVYLTIGNIDTAIHHQPSKQAMVLLGYLPVTKLECLSPECCKEHAYYLFHYCMSLILEPLIAASKDGVYMTCSDSQIHHLFLILASYIANNPEQCLVAAIRENSCPICKVSLDDHGNPGCAPSHNPSTILTALRSLEMGTPSPAFQNLHLCPIPQPFWADLPYTNIFECFTPDLLHQLHKGVFKDHMVKWCIQIAGKGGAQEVDEQLKCLPDHPGLRHFKKGISTISQWTAPNTRGYCWENSIQIFLEFPLIFSPFNLASLAQKLLILSGRVMNPRTSTTLPQPLSFKLRP